jgi:DeoR family transcriptional regulator, aga operon transcriptional repressor
MDSDPNLSNIERQRKILAEIQKRQRISVTYICELYKVSEATARRDLEQMASQGKIQRVHGGAIAIQPQVEARSAPPELPVIDRSMEQCDEKQRIGAAAAGLIRDGETVFISSGTTAVEVARNLRNRRNLTVITNSLPVIHLLAAEVGITLVNLGGILRPSEQSFIGHIAEQSLAEVRADKVIFGIRSIDLEQGLTNDYLPETRTDRAILKIGREVIVVADHTKLGRLSTAFVAPLSAIQRVVTDRQAPAEFVQALEMLGIQVLVV